MIQHNMIIELR